MIRIHRFEQMLEILHKQGKIRSTLHLAEGQEAIGAGFSQIFTENDIVFTGHRPDHILLAKGLSSGLLLAEIMNDKKGPNQGHSGQMHLFSKRHGIWGTNGIVAANISISVGAALARKMKNQDGIVYSFFGDGATTEGEFHEALNIASLWKVPIIFVCENNQYAQSTSTHKHSANTAYAEKVEIMYKIKTTKVNGNNPEKVYYAAADAVAYVKKEQKPFFIEATTYRTSGHSINDKDQAYKTEGEEIFWEQREPIKSYISELIKQDVLRPDTEQKLENEVLSELNEALIFAGVTTPSQSE